MIKVLRNYDAGKYKGKLQKNRKRVIGTSGMRVMGKLLLHDDCKRVLQTIRALTKPYPVHGLSTKVIRLAFMKQNGQNLS